ncbi:hypothetical protein [Fundidesulfovibrio soli]|uniref:hypothetical protein n=1 Tax=Fundidesulfovibrio soli TaxID=2922716 RepID=UPI001FAF8D80|nr:hypothetical protein [Fundidesulfovibrio soli]
MGGQPERLKGNGALCFERKAVLWGFFMGVICFALASAILFYFMFRNPDILIAKIAGLHSGTVAAAESGPLRELRQEQSRRGLEKAKKYLEKDDLANAGLFFSNALANSSQKIEIISGYTDAVVRWQERQRADGGSKNAGAFLITDMITLLNMQVVYVTPPEMPALMEAMTKLEQLEQVPRASGESPPSLPIDEALVAKIDALLQTTVPTAPDTLEQQERELGDLIAGLGTFNNTGHVADLLSRLEEKRQNIRKLSETYSVCNRAKDFLKKAEQGEPGSDFTAYYVSAAESILRQIIPLQDDLTGFDQSVSVQLSAELDRVSKVIIRKKSEKEFDKVDALYQKVKKFESISASYKCQEAIDALTGFLNEAQPTLVAIADPDVGRRAREFITQNGALLKNWGGEQQNRYDRWALKEISDLYGETKQYIGKISSDNDRINSALRRYIDDIDTRLLSPTVSRAYSEVYELFVRELKDEQKIELAKHFAVSSKKSLMNF